MDTAVSGVVRFASVFTPRGKAVAMLTPLPARARAILFICRLSVTSRPEVMSQWRRVDALNPADGSTDVVSAIHSSDSETSPTIEKDRRACFIGDGHGAAARASVVETHSGLKRLTERQSRVSSLPLFPSLTQLEKDILWRWMIGFRLP